MPSLQAAHRGYEYQDLLCAMRLVDLVLGTVAAAWVDVKLVEDDRFDDLTVVTVDGSRERTQFKHSDNDDKPLNVETFTSDKRDLRLDRLVAAAIADRDGPGSGASTSSFRVVLRDAWPEDEVLTSVLVAVDPDPGPFVAGMPARRLRFDVDRLWPLNPAPTKAGKKQARSRFAFLRSGAKAVDRADLAWLCERLVIEVEAPRSSGDLVAPDLAERILLARVRDEVGAGSYPNADRSAEDVAEAFATFARQARQGRVSPSAPLMLQRAQLRKDFGAVSRVDPIDHSVEVARPATLADVNAAAAKAARSGVPLLLTGSPGQGKSWVCAQLVPALIAEGWLVAEHFCFLNDTRDERDERVNADTVFGSLLGRLADADPTLVADQRPRYAADDVAVTNAVSRAVRAKPDRPVALVVDGLDHVARIRSAPPGTDQSATLAAALAALDLPVGSVLIVLSQPGAHLEPLRDAGANELPIPGLTDTELQKLALRFGLLASLSTPDPLVDEQFTDGFLAALTNRSQRNALYATYLCREILRRPEGEADPTALLLELPQFDGTLENYYTHLMARLGPGHVVAEVVGLLGFPVTRAELGEMRPELGHLLDDALAILAPVLAERATQGGLRVYHESFARFLRRQMEGNPLALAANLRFVVEWLTGRGFYRDERAFRFLLPTLAAAGRDAEVLDLVGIDFAAKAVAGGHPASAITANLATASSCAAELKDIPALARILELSSAAESFEEERLDSAVLAYIDVPMVLLGSQEFASRLLFDGQTSVPARAGLQLCSALDAAGVVPPWLEYMSAFDAWLVTNNTSYGAESDSAVALAWMRGQLRQMSVGVNDQATTQRIATFLNKSKLRADETIPIVVEVLGIRPAAELVDFLEIPEDAALALAEAASLSVDPEASELMARLLAVAAGRYRPGTAHRWITLGVKPQDLGPSSTDLCSSLIEFTRTATSEQAMHVKDAVLTWLDLCAIAARRDIGLLATVDGLLDGEGWYRCWLRFAVALVRAEVAADSDRAALALRALRLLTGDLRRSKGKPRAYDLYPILSRIENTLLRAIGLLADDDWPTALDILKQVVNGVGVNMRGQDAGPITPDFLLNLAVSATTAPARRPATQAMIDEALAEGGEGRYYSTSAEYRLVAARFALAHGDVDRAQRLWDEACQMLTAYGWHKDITIYEVLDPLSSLIAADRGRAQVRLARLQATCKRVLRHTDGKSTRGAWIQWWKLLAEADPAALTRLAVSALLEQCGEAYDLYNGALEELWRSWHHEADPIVAALLRLALPTPLEDSDRVLVERLAMLADRSRTDNVGRLLTLVLARADERPRQHIYSNNDELIAEDNARIEAVNMISASVNAPQIGIEPAIADNHSSTPPQAPRVSPENPYRTSVTEFPDGAVGIARAIRAWRRRPYDATDPAWAPQRFANIIGYRLLELAQAGHEPDVIAALHTLASALDTLERNGLLTALGQGLERHGHSHLAAVALALAWTHTRGQGGWMNFGGQAELESLSRATTLDPDAALATVTSEVTRVVAGSRGGSRGVTQALIYALADGALTTGQTSLDTAFAAWDQANAVIDARTPRMADDDDPNMPYTPLLADDIDKPVAEIDTTFAEAIIGMLAHPGHESRRRTLLAFTILLEERPVTAAAALATTLPSLKDPAVLSWLLKIIHDAGDAAAQVVTDACHDTFQELASGPHLTVRALAARLLGDDAAPPPMTQPDAALLDTHFGALWLPEVGDPADDTAAMTVAALAGARLAAAETMLPRLGRAVTDRIDHAMSAPGFEEAIDREKRELSDKSHRRWADAFTGREALVEDALQRAAAGGRAALIAAATPPVDSAAWEYELARLLVNDPFLPLAVEDTRHPRPVVTAPPEPHDPIWSQKRTAKALTHEGDSGGSDVLVQVGTWPAERCETMPAGRYQRWRIIACTEEHIHDAHPYEGQDKLRASLRSRAVELRHPDDPAGLNSPPFTVDTVANWFGPSTPIVGAGAPQRSRALAAIDRDGRSLMDTPFGLGIHEPLLVPAALLRSILHLQPTEPLVLRDATGPALALITWRSHYETSDYHLPWPRRTGSALLLSPIAFDDLLAWGSKLLVMREVVSGDTSFANTVD